MKKIKIAVGDSVLEAELNDTETAKKIAEALPIEAKGNMWGDEIYFTIPVSAELENGKTIVEIGDLGYWPTGGAFCIFYGRTPLSSDEKPVPASAVTPIGKITSDVSILKGIPSGMKVRIEGNSDS